MIACSVNCYERISAGLASSGGDSECTSPHLEVCGRHDVVCDECNKPIEWGKALIYIPTRDDD